VQPAGVPKLHGQLVSTKNLSNLFAKEAHMTLMMSKKQLHSTSYRCNQSLGNEPPSLSRLAAILGYPNATAQEAAGIKSMNSNPTALGKILVDVFLGEDR